MIPLELLPLSTFTNHGFRPARLEAVLNGSVVTVNGTGEGDIGLDDAASYRLYREHRTNRWFVEGGYY
jgi:hypothetical protein